MNYAQITATASGVNALSISRWSTYTGVAVNFQTASNETINAANPHWRNGIWNSGSGVQHDYGIWTNDGSTNTLRVKVVANTGTMYVYNSVYSSGLVIGAMQGNVGGQAFKGYNGSTNDASNWQALFCGYGADDDKYKHGFKTFHANTGPGNKISWYIHNPNLNPVSTGVPTRCCMSINGDGLLNLEVAGGSALTGLSFAGDCNLYRTAAGYLKTDSKVGFPLHTMFHVMRGTSFWQITTNNSTIPLNAEAGGPCYDANNYWTYDGGTNNGYFTVPVTGIYLIGFNVVCYGNSVSDSVTVITVAVDSGNILLSTTHRAHSVSDEFTMSASGTAVLTAGTYVKLKGRVNNGTVNVSWGTNDPNTTFYAHLLSAQ